MLGADKSWHIYLLDTDQSHSPYQDVLNAGCLHKYTFKIYKIEVFGHLALFIRLHFDNSSAKEGKQTYDSAPMVGTIFERHLQKRTLKEGD